MAQLALNSKMKEINKKREMLSKLYDPDLLVPIIINKNVNKVDMIRDNLRKSSIFMKKTTFNNLFSEQYISSSTNENMLTTTSNNNKKDNLKKMILKKSVSNVK